MKSQVFVLPAGVYWINAPIRVIREPGLVANERDQVIDGCALGATDRSIRELRKGSAPKSGNKHKAASSAHNVRSGFVVSAKGGHRLGGGNHTASTRQFGRQHRKPKRDFLHG